MSYLCLPHSVTVFIPSEAFELDKIIIHALYMWLAWLPMEYMHVGHMTGFDSKPLSM